MAKRTGARTSGISPRVTGTSPPERGGIDYASVEGFDSKPPRRTAQLMNVAAAAHGSRCNAGESEVVGNSTASLGDR